MQFSPVSPVFSFSMEVMSLKNCPNSGSVAVSSAKYSVFKGCHKGLKYVPLILLEWAVDFAKNLMIDYNSPA